MSVPLGVPVAQGAPSSRYRYGTAMGSVANQYSGHPNLFSGFGSDPGSLNPYVYVGNNPATLTDPTGQNPLLAACAVGAAGSVLVDVGINLATGMKVTGSQVLQSAGSGCVGGLVGFGAGKVAGQVVAKLFSSAGPEAESLILFGQRSVSRTFTAAEAGSTFRYAGQKISDVASALRSGAASPDELTIQYIVRNGQRIAINNRSLLALRRAGMRPTSTVDVTGDPTLEARLSERLVEMGGAPANFIRVRGAGAMASF